MTISFCDKCRKEIGAMGVWRGVSDVHTDTDGNSCGLSLMYDAHRPAAGVDLCRGCFAVVLANAYQKVLLGTPQPAGEE